MPLSADGNEKTRSTVSPTVTLPIGNSESNLIGQFVFLTGLELIAGGKPVQVGFANMMVGENPSAKGYLPIESNKNNQYHAVCGIYPL